MKKNLAACVFVSALLLASCAKVGPTGPTGPAGPPGPSYTGAISGHASLFDQYGSKVLIGLNTVQLSLNGGAAITADANGYYIFPGVTTGDYSISISASGYAASRANKFQFVADTLNRDVKLSAVPNFSPASFAIYPSIVPAGDSLVISFTADTRLRNCIVFLNNTAAVNSMPAGYLLSYIKNIPANATDIRIVIPKQDYIDAGMTPGAMVYYAAYSYVISDASAYEDFSTGKTVYNAVGVTPIIDSAVAP